MATGTATSLTNQKRLWFYQNFLMAARFVFSVASDAPYTGRRQVSFEVEDGPKGPQALNVWMLITISRCRQNPALCGFVFRMIYGVASDEKNICRWFTANYNRTACLKSTLFTETDQRPVLRRLQGPGRALRGACSHCRFKSARWCRSVIWQFCLVRQPLFLVVNFPLTTL